MNKYNFDELIDRSGNSIKWDVAENELPMWVADRGIESESKTWSVWVLRY